MSNDCLAGHLDEVPAKSYPHNCTRHRGHTGPHRCGAYECEVEW